MSDATASQHDAANRNPSVGKLMIIVVVGFAVLKIAQSAIEGYTPRVPGKESGDITLTEDTLPDQIGSWTRSTFQAALPPESLPQGQTWWSHSWTYDADSKHRALVAFDQANWCDWHELTICYRANDWQLTRRDVLSAQSHDTAWPYTVARFQREGDLKGLLVFSLFYDDGSPVAPPQFTADQATETGLMAQLRNRRQIAGGRMSGRSLQSQVFVPYQGELSDEVINNIIQLHFASREEFRAEWLRQKTAEDVAAEAVATP